ncbi:S9 family peptidase [Dysgonomonas sp. 216]|uniref:S9 family peptidase n=1 Tax=Dysgonomonas sp. 216 TaxID=2302934 RepID=UPI0013D22674|nr:S9 family peptidase [Dysgonomonas sp. 216]NDW19523.1 S9 family peptidase [Dysgonomonas sp. 216]
MTIRGILFSILIVFSAALFAQRKISVDRVYTTKPIDVVMPVMLDSTNLKGEKFENKNLLETFISIPPQNAFTEPLSSEVTRDYFFFSKPQSGARFHLLSFQLNADRYCKARLKVTSPGMFEAYINEKKEITKTSIEDSLKNAKVMDKEFTTTPGTTTFFIKYMSLSSSKLEDEGVKIAIESEKDDSITVFKVQPTGKQLITIQDIARADRVTDARISPNGRFVLLRYRIYDKEGKSSDYSQILDIQTNRRVNLGSKYPNWMPTSNKIYYTESRNGKLHFITLDPEVLTETIVATDIPSGGFYISPDEKSLYYTDKESGNEQKGDLKRLLSPEDRQPGYLDRYFIYKYDLNSGLKQRLTFGKHSTYINDISADSRYLLFSTTKETTTERPFRNISMYKLDVNTLALDTIWKDEAFAHSALFSPDGTKILIGGAPEAFAGIGLNVPKDEIPNSYDGQAYIMDLKTKDIKAITKDFNPSVSSMRWNNSDKMIYMRVTDRDYESVYRYNPQNGSYTRLDLPEEVVQLFSLSRGTTNAVITGESTSNFSRAYYCDLKTGKSTLIANPMQEKLDNLNLGEVKDWNFTSSDGTTIEGRYYLPPNFDKSKKYPAIVYYYGGTMPTSRTLVFPYPMHVYAAMGYVVYVLQPSGTIGYGQEFSARHVNAWGKRTADDIIEGTKKFIEEHPYIDASKIGCIGASYGGFMTMYLQTQTDMFAAAVSHAGISSISSYWGEGYWGYTYSSGASAFSYPWNNKKMYVDQSPLFNADKIKTPLLLLHGTNDTNVPIGESIQMYTALKVLGRPVEFIQVKDENHGISNYKRRIEWNYSIYAWFAKWLKDDQTWWNSLYPENKK